MNRDNKLISLLRIQNFTIVHYRVRYQKWPVVRHYPPPSRDHVVSIANGPPWLNRVKKIGDSLCDKIRPKSTGFNFRIFIQFRDSRSCQFLTGDLTATDHWPLKPPCPWLVGPGSDVKNKVWVFSCFTHYLHHSENVISAH